MIIFVILYFALIIFMIVSLWKVFEKAGQPGWAAIVPVYNLYVLVTGVARLEILWFILCFVPFVNIIAVFKIYIAVAEEFGKGAAFGIGLVFLGFIFFPMLAFGDAKHSSQRRGRRGSRGRGYGDYDDEDDRPRRKRRVEEDEDEDEDDRPRKKRRYEEDEAEEDERPSRRRRAAEDDEEEERPRRNRRDDDGEDERPSRRRRRDDDD